MLIRQTTRITGQNDIKCITRYLNYIRTRSLCTDINKNTEPTSKKERKLRQWRKDPEPGPAHFLGMWDREQVAPRAKRDTSFGDPTKNATDFDFSIANVKSTLNKWMVEYKIENQKYIPERLNILGTDLGAAHFLLYRNGKVKFKGMDEWLILNEKEDINLPRTYDPTYILTAVDCTGLELYYEGLMNFENLTKVKWASFKGNPVLDEWCLDHISANFPCLEYLDISNCPKVNERGLEALYKLFYLKTLIVTNHHKSAAFELTCMMLEDCNPNLKCEIIEPEKESVTNVV